MVEIKPYLDEDEEEEENWIPLNPTTSSQPPKQHATVSTVENESTDDSRKISTVDVVSSVCSEDEDDGWQKLNTSHIITSHQSQPAAAAAPVSSLLELLPGLSSITKVTTVPIVEENNDDDSESGIVWKRPDALEENSEIKLFRNTPRNVVGEDDIAEDYNDDELSSMKFDPTSDDEHLRSTSSKPRSVVGEESKKKESTSARAEDTPIRKEERNHQQQPSAPSRPQQQREQQQSRPSSSSRIKTKLQEKFIHDPLRSLPFNFVYNFYLEMKYQLSLAWKCYFAINTANGDGSSETSIDTGALAAIVLYVIIALFALGLIISGVIDIGSALLSTLIWSVKSSFQTCCDGMIPSIYATSALGMVILLKSRGWFEVSLQVPSLSNALPVLVAVTSSSMYEIITIGLSVHIILSMCAISSTSAVTVAAIAILSPVSILIVMNLVSFSELEACDITELKGNDPPLKQSLLGRTIHRMRKYPHECHAIGIVTLVGFGIILVLIRDGVFIFSSLRMVRICVSIGAGVFILERLRDSILEAIDAKNRGGVANGLSFNHISRVAMKKSLMEVSTSAFWSKDDTGNMILGILSEEDSELRYAILGWIIDQWKSAPTSDDQTSGEQDNTPDDQPAAGSLSQLHESNISSEKRASISGSTRESEETFDNEFSRNDDVSSEAEFRANNSSFQSGGDCKQSTLSYQSLQSVISKLDADEALIPAIDRYKEWVHSLKPHSNLAFGVAVWKLCPAMVVFGVIFVFSVVRGSFQVIFFYTIGMISVDSIGNIQYVFIVAAVLSPLLLIEYIALSAWWTRHFADQNAIPDTITIMLEGEDRSPKLFFYPIAQVTDTSALLLRVWKLLLESIALLESSIPAVRCATVASCTANLAVDTMTLVDLAFEIQKRGIIGGVGLLIWDAFNHHLKEEIQQRRSDEGDEADGDESFDGKYTGAAINSARNIGKISQNIGGLMASKKDHQDETMKGEENSNGGEAAGDDHFDSPFGDDVKVSAAENAEVPNLSNEETNSRSICNDGVDTSAKTQESCADKVDSEILLEQKEEGNKLMPVLIGGGLAIAGALIGGMTVAAANNKDEHNEKMRSEESENK